MNKEIEEIAKDLSTILLAEAEYYCDSEGGIVTEKFAERLFNAGYRKTVWHKVADGDLPKDDSNIIFTITIDGIPSSTVGWYNARTGVFVSYHFGTFDNVTAWTELPRYEEQSNDN